MLKFQITSKVLITLNFNLNNRQIHHLQKIIFTRNQNILQTEKDYSYNLSKPPDPRKQPPAISRISFLPLSSPSFSFFSPKKKKVQKKQHKQKILIIKLYHLHQTPRGRRQGYQKRKIVPKKQKKKKDPLLSSVTKRRKKSSSHTPR